MLPPVQRYAQEGRSYALVCALIVGRHTCWCGPRTRRTPGAWAAYGAVLLAACLLHEFARPGPARAPAGAPALARRPALRVALAVCAGLAPLSALSMRQSDQVSWIGGLGTGALLGFAGVSALALTCAAPLRRGPVPRLALPLTILPALTLIVLTPLKPLYVDRYVLYGHAGTALP